jgi:single-stranded-DNA-specific exonuclease
MEPDLIITVDNGIASLEGAREVAKLESRTGKRVELLITDHHLPLDSGELPPADSIINPSQPGCPFPSKAIAGCGVMFYTVMALRSHLRDVGHFEAQGAKPPSILQLLDLVALGTVADVVALDRNNRILVDAGIRWIKAGHGRPGIRALLEVGRRDPAKLIAQDFGFAVGPGSMQQVDSRAWIKELSACLLLTMSRLFPWLSVLMSLISSAGTSKPITSSMRIT